VKRRRPGRTLLKILLGLVLFLGLTVAAMTGLMWCWQAKPPVLIVEPALTQLTPEQRDDRVYLGQNWFGQRDGLSVLYITGSPFELGYATGVLTQDGIHRQEEAVLQFFHRAAPYRWTQFLLKFLVVWKNRALPEHVLPDYQMEIYGISRGSPDTYPSEGPHYHRILNYHAAQDISYMLMNSPLIRGCTAFGAWTNATADGHLLVARNFDWEADPVFDEERIVILCEPDRGIPFVSLAWAGMAGCVSGLNREGLSIIVNGAPSDLPGNAATPTCLVAREVLQYAATLDEAVDIIRKREVFVSAIFLVGSRRDGRCIAVEKTPELTAIRTPQADAVMVCANHYRTPDLAGLALNQKFLATDTSGTRGERMEELVARAFGRLDPRTAAAILRDPLLPGDRDVGRGHRASLNPLIATHAVIMDLDDGLFWAGQPPHQLGRFVAFDVVDFQRQLPERAIPEDPWFSAGGYEQYREFRSRLAEGWTQLRGGDPQTALARAADAAALNPGFYAVSWLEAEALFALERFGEAEQACDAALDGAPALASERRRLKTLQAAAEGRRRGAATQ